MQTLTSTPPQNECSLDRITRMFIQLLIDTGTPREQAFDEVMNWMVRS